MPELWVPGAAEPSIESFVEHVLAQIERFAKEAPGGEVQVELELRDGSVIPLESILPEPGYGFVTLRPHGRRKEEVVIPVGAIARLRLSPPEEHPPFGFSKPGE
ncbi:MAG TPA: hypothetical protein VLJ76_09140 [Gaiellaceae bacterium]|nr:hypothetical protein [Gaiellaceae bacterium]